MCNVINRKERNQGMNWISQHKRLAIYMRDGLACAYCGAKVEDGVKLTLDHCIPHVKGGSNHETNLVTSCITCNSSRGDRPLVTFIKSVCDYYNRDTKSIELHIRNCRRRKLNTKEAKELVDRRGSCFNVLQDKIKQL